MQNLYLYRTESFFPQDFVFVFLAVIELTGLQNAIKVFISLPSYSSVLEWEEWCANFLIAQLLCQKVQSTAKFALQNKIQFH